MNVLDNGPGAAGDEPEGGAAGLHRSPPRVLERRSTHRLEKIAARLEVLEGYLAVYLNLDKVIKIIRTEDEPKPKLMKAFRLTEIRPKPSSTCGCAPCASWRKWKSAREHADLTKEQKELTKLLGSDKLKSEKLIEEVKAIDAKFGLKTELGKRRTEIAGASDVAEIVGAGRRSGRARQRGGEGADHHRLLRERAGCARSRAIRNESDAIKYREGDRARFWIHAQTTDKLMMLATDGRFFTLDCASCPAGAAMARRSAASSTCRRKPTSSPCSCMCRAASCCWPPTSGHGFITMKTTPSP